VGLKTKEFETVKRSGGEIKPSLNSSDQELLTDQLAFLNAKLQKAASTIHEKLNGLSQDLEKLSLISNLLQKSKNFIAKVKAELNELARPLGSKTEDSQGLLGSYEVST
jgi:hypothetical protein